MLFSKFKSLKFFIFVFRFVGLNLKSKPFSSWKNILFNIFYLFIAIFITILTIVDFYEFKITQSLPKCKPSTIISLLLHDYGNYVFIIKVIQFILLQFYGNSLVRIMDHRIFKMVYRNWIQSGLIFAFIIVLILAPFLIYFNELYELINNRFLFSLALSHYFIYSNTLLYTPLFILHYIKYGTLQQLQLIHLKLRNKLMLSLSEVFERIKFLAHCNELISQKLTLSILSYLCFTWIQLISSFYTFQFTTNYIQLVKRFLFCTMVLIYLLYIIYLDRKIKSILIAIDENLFEKNYSTETMLIFLFRLKSIRKKKFFTEQMRIIEFFQLYSEQFSINLYYLIQINLEFFLKYLLFILSYVVLIIQTTNSEYEY